LAGHDQEEDAPVVDAGQARHPIRSAGERCHSVMLRKAPKAEMTRRRHRKLFRRLRKAGQLRQLAGRVTRHDQQQHQHRPEDQNEDQIQDEQVF
jgi:hypothetical protein